VSTDPAHSLSDIFGERIGDRQTTLAPGLDGLEIDPDAEAERHLVSVKTAMKALVHPRLYAEIDRQLDLARHAPGATEAALLERVARLMAGGESRHDLVLFDTAPSGHTVRLLTLPEIMAAWTDGLLASRARAGRLAASLRHFGGGRHTGDELTMIDAPQDHAPGSTEAGIAERLTTRRRLFQEARAALVDPTAAAFVLVVNPDKLSILEGRRTADILSRFGVPVTALVVNRVLPPDADGAFLGARREQEAHYLQGVGDTFPDLPRLVLPLRPRDVSGRQALAEMAALLRS
jgi:arsenite-transporting ATPase